MRLRLVSWACELVLVDLGLTIGVKGYPQPLAGSRRTGVEG